MYNKKLSWNKINKPIIALSPMADMTDSSFCRVVKEVTGETDFPVVFREMVSSEAVVRGSEKTLDMTDIHEAERPIVQQIFGSDPIVMREALEKIQTEHSPDGFDVNMGCPVYKITSNFNGCALMKDPKNSSEIVKQMIAGSNVPVSVKIRLGWSDINDCLSFAPAMEQAGATLITVHGRTKEQGYSGVSNWEQIAKVKKTISIPMLANGDIHTPESLIKALEITKADGALIARGALGNPWIFKQMKDILETGKYEIPTIDEKIIVIRRHLDLHIMQYGDLGIRTFRKHLTWYFKGYPNAKFYRDKMNRAENIEELNEVFNEILKSKDF
jgi:tRNA-dihydrouridine synthase B